MAERGSLVRLRRELELDLQWRGFELHPDTPRGGMRVAQMFPGPRAEGMRRHLRAFAQGFDVQIGEPERIPNTRWALAVAEIAREAQKLDAFRDAAMDAHWREGRDLEDEATLEALAVGSGLGPGAARRALEEPRWLALVDEAREESLRLGVTGIPTFLIGRARVVGCQGYQVLEQVALSQGATRRGRGG